MQNKNRQRNYFLINYVKNPVQDHKYVIKIIEKAENATTLEVLQDKRKKK